MRTPYLPWILILILVGGCDGTDPEEGDPDESVVATVPVSVDLGSGRRAISPFIYGSNQDRGDDLWTVRRLGGNRLTGYNWETNHSNAGDDFQHFSDLWLVTNAGIPLSQAAEPARVMTFFHDQSLQMGAASVLTLQMAGYVAGDDFGPVTAAETAPSARWERVEPRSTSALPTSPNLRDGVVYMDELVDYLVRRYGGAAAATGVRWYSLDNEPALWAATHPRIHPEPLRAADLIDRSVALASAVKDIDPDSEIMGPALYGFAAYRSLQDAPDWNDVSQGTAWFVDYYLDQMRRAGEAQGRRLLDVLDVHWYPEARGDNRITEDGVSEADVEARLQAPRSLWDPSYDETSWIAECCATYLPLIPRLQVAIGSYYPGTRLAVSEYNYGAGHVISGGLAQADVLGIFGREGVYLAALWGIEPRDIFQAAAFALYRNYDGNGGQFGDTSVEASVGDRARLSAYAAIAGDDDTRLHLILINKSRDGAVEAAVNLAGAPGYIAARAWGFDARNATPTRRDGVDAVSGDTFSYVLPPLSAVHLVIE